MLVQQVLHTVDAEPFPSGAGEQDVSVTSLGLTQPGLQDNEGGSGEGRTAFFAPLSNYPHVGTGSQNATPAGRPRRGGWELDNRA